MGNSRNEGRSLSLTCGIILAPALEAIEYENIVFNGTLDYPSPYRGQPNDDIDAAWNRIASSCTLLRVVAMQASPDPPNDISDTHPG